MVGSSLDYPGDPGGVGLPSPPWKGGGGRSGFEEGLHFWGSSAQRTCSPVLFLLLFSLIHLTLSEVCRSSHMILAHGVGNAEVVCYGGSTPVYALLRLGILLTLG
jgi:hypothetical protein